MIEIKNLKKSYGELVVYEDFSVSFSDNQITTILGESGCGKTTLLNILAGLIPFASGEIQGDYKPAAFIFQNDRLLPNLTVIQNLKFVLGDEVDVLEDLKRAGLYDFRNSYIKDLSGGMMRRICILRAFLYPSKSLFMDEPFLNIDLKLKYSLMDMFLEFYGGKNKTTIFVTHNIDEAEYLSDRVIILKEGKIVLDINKGEKKFGREYFKNILING